MKHVDLHRAVARAAGESVATVKRIGFLIDDPEVKADDAEPPDLGPCVLDWDQVELWRRASLQGETSHEPTAC